MSPKTCRPIRSELGFSRRKSPCRGISNEPINEFDTALLAPIGILIILLMIVLSGFFSGSETALTAAIALRMHHAGGTEGDLRAGIVNAADRPIATG